MSEFTVLNPATEEAVTTVTQASAEETDAAIDRAAAAQEGWRAVAPGDRAAPAAPVRGRRGRARRRAGRPGGRRVRPSHRPGPLGGRARPRRAALLLRGARAADRAADPGARRAERHLPRAGRRGRADRAVELPDADPVLGHGAGPGRGEHRGRQAGRDDPADRDPDRRAGRSRPACPTGCFQVLPGQGSVVGQRLVDHPAVRKIVFTGSTEVGREVMAGCAAAGQAGHPGARRQERQHRVRRRRPRAGRRDRAVRGVRQRRAGLLRPVPDPGRSARCSTGSWSCSSPRCRASWSATRPRPAPRWAR